MTYNVVALCGCEIEVDIDDLDDVDVDVDVDEGLFELLDSYRGERCPVCKAAWERSEGLYDGPDW